jgi:hypothetical protein
MAAMRFIINIFKEFGLLYIQGIRSMTLGKTLWKIVAIKLLVLFAIFKLFFFPDVLKVTYHDDTQRAEHVIAAITNGHRSAIEAP